jgi:FAD/FMN-containing dehydrogenase
MPLADDIRRLDCGDVESDIDTLARYSHDASIFQVTPEAVVFPRSGQDIMKLVAYAASHSGVNITARAAGTCMSGGAIGQSIVMDSTRYLNAMTDLERDTSVAGQDGYAVVQPGMYYRDFERATLVRNLQYPVYPASRDLCAIGGIVSNNAGGEKSLVYGQTVDFVRSVRAVLSDGKEYDLGPLTKTQLDAKMAHPGFEGSLYRGLYELIESNYDTIKAARPKVSKNSAGYQLWHVWDRTTFNMAKLICGAQGTLGIVTEATLGLVKPKPHKSMLVMFLDDFQQLATVVKEVLQFKPETLESFDDKTLWFTLRFLPDFVRILGASNIISLGLKFLPEAWMVLRGGMPKLIVIAEFTGDDADHVNEQALHALLAVRAHDIKARLTKGEEESHKYWAIRRSSFNVIRSHTKGKRTTPFIDDFIIPPKDMPTFLPELYDILRPYKLVLTVAGHVGDGNFHIIPLMDLKDARTRTIIPELSKKVYDLVLHYGGSITAEHNDGLIRGPYLKQMYGEKVYELFRSVKHLFDPANIFNPGKKVDVDWNWALAHIRQD